MCNACLASCWKKLFSICFQSNNLGNNSNDLPWTSNSSLLGEMQKDHNNGNDTLQAEDVTPLHL